MFIGSNIYIGKPSKWTIELCHHTDATEATNILTYNEADYPAPEK